MATYTLTGDLSSRVGEELTSPTGQAPRAYLIPYAEAVAEGSEVLVGPVELTLDADGVFSQADIPEGGYRVEVRYFSPSERAIRYWSTLFFNLDADLDLSEVVENEEFIPAIPGLSIGTVTSGSPAEVTLVGGELNFVIPNGPGDYPGTFVTKTSAYTANVDEYVLADTTSGGFNVYLPLSVAAGSVIGVKKISADANTLTISPSGGGNIDGDATLTTITQNAGVTVKHAGSNVWRVVAVSAMTGPAGADGADAALSTIEDEGSSLTQRSTMNFTGAGVTATDSGGKTVVNIPGGSGGGRRMRTGRVSTPAGTVTNKTMSLGYEYVMPFDVPVNSITVTDVGINVVTAGTTSVIQFGIRNDNDGAPGSVVISAAATVDSSTTGFKETALSTTLAVGSYWLCARATGGSNPTVSGNQGIPISLAAITISNGSTAVISGYSDNGGGSGAITGTHTPAFTEQAVPRIMLKIT